MKHNHVLTIEMFEPSLTLCWVKRPNALKIRKNCIDHFDSSPLEYKEHVNAKNRFNFAVKKEISSLM